MLLILASAWDQAAQALASRWVDDGARLLTPLDLSRKGWRWRLGATSGNSGVTQEGLLDPGAIRGVLTRLPCVYDREVPHIIAEDRVYVAAEMQAFLFAWLSGLRCPVLNRPSAFCLSGPPWRHEQWVSLAARIGLSVEPVRRVAALGSDYPNPMAAHPDPAVITIAGVEHVGLLDSVLTAQAFQLAAAAGVDLLTVFFSSARPDAKFIGVSLWPNIADPSIADLILRYFRRACVRGSVA